jgi:hypothetical protein
VTQPSGPGHPGREFAPGVRPFLHTKQAARNGEDVDGNSTLRPFVITSGRVDGPDPNINMETQVSVHPGAAPGRLPPEKRAIVTLCVEPLSVAEISARLRMHLGVTRILVGDLRATGHLEVHVLDNDFPDPETIMRVIRGLRSIS